MDTKSHGSHLPTSREVFATSQTLVAESARARLDGAHWDGGELGWPAEKWLLTGDTTYICVDKR